MFTYLPYITDGSGDNSCDIIFDAKDTRDENIYYVIQSKWNTKSNVTTEIGSKEINHAISDFRTILRSNKKATENNKFNEKLSQLSEHFEKGGLVKFIVSFWEGYPPSLDGSFSMLQYSDERIQTWFSYDIFDSSTYSLGHIVRKY